MTHRLAIHHALILMLGMMVMWYAAPAHADNVIPNVNCSTTYAGIANKIAGCIRQTVDEASAIYFDKFYGIVQTAVMAAATLAVLLYGCMMAFGMVEKIGRDSIVLLIKIGAVFWFCSSSGLIYSTVTQLMDTASIAVVTYTPVSGQADSGGTDFSQSQCMQNMIEQQVKATDDDKKYNPVTGPWLAIDCLIDTVIGIRTKTLSGPNASFVWYNQHLDNPDASKVNDGAARSLLFFFFSDMQSSILGILLAVIGFIFIYGLLMMIVKALFTYLAGYMGIAFLVIISPLIIPLVMFSSTKGYFDKWVKLLISFALQPVIMLVFIIFSLTAIDLAVFSGTYSIVYRIAGDASREPYFDLNKYLTAKRMQIDRHIIDTGNPALPTSKPIIVRAPRPVILVKGAGDTNDPIPADSTKPKDLGGVLSGIMRSKCTDKEMNADPALKKMCGYQYPIQVWTNSMDWETMAAARTPAVVVPPVKPGDPAPTGTPEQQAGQQIAREVLASVLFCGVIVYILNGLLAVVPLVAYDLMGDFGMSPNLGSAGKALGTDLTKSISPTANAGINRAGNAASNAGSNFANKISDLIGKR